MKKILRVIVSNRKKIILFVLPFVAVHIFISNASAGVGSVSQVLPNNASNMSDGSARNAWTMVSSCYTANCMRARNTLSLVYVPISTSTFDFTITHGCFVRGVDSAFYYSSGNYEEGSSSTYSEYHLYNSLQNPSIPDIYGLPSDFPAVSVDYLRVPGGYPSTNLTTKTRVGGSSGTRVCPNGTTDITRSVTVNHAAAPKVTVNGTEYSVFIFHARSNTSFYYANQFRLSLPAGVLAGFTTLNASLDGEVFWTAVSSAVEGSGNNPKWQTFIEFAPPCSATPTLYTREFAWFDADNGVYQFGDELRYTIEELNRDDTPTGVVYSGIITGGNSALGSATYTYNSAYKYRLRVYGIAEVNSQQFRLPFDQVYAFSDDCGNNGPTGSMVLQCDDAGQVSFNGDPIVRDPVAGTVSVTSSPVSHGGNILSGSVEVVANTDKIITISGVPFGGIRDNAPKTVTLAITGPSGTGSMSATYTCKKPPPGISCEFSVPGEVSIGYPLRILKTEAKNSVSGSGSFAVTMTIRVYARYPVGTPIWEKIVGPLNVNDDNAFVDFNDLVLDPLILPAIPTLTETITYPVVAFASWDYGGNQSVYCNGGTTCAPGDPTCCPVDEPLCCPSGCEEMTQVTYPYFKAFGGDLLSYNGVIQSYNMAGPPADPLNFTTLDNTGRRGSSAQGAILQSTGDIDGVASGATRTVPSQLPRGLSFANTGVAKYGGSFGAGYVVPPARVPPTTPTLIANIDLSAYGENSVTTMLVENDVTIYGTVKEGVRLDIYTTKDVSISGDITYPDTYDDIDAIPLVRIISLDSAPADDTVDPYVFIRPDVGRVDAQIISQGTIYTCHSGLGDLTGSYVYIECRTTLFLNGGIIAKKVLMTRSRGSIHVAGPNENNAISLNNNVAEVLRFSYEGFLKPDATPDTPLTTKYQSFTALPPLF